MVIRVAIVEDERQEAQALKQCLCRFGEKQKVEFSITHFEDAALFLRQYQPVYDLIFMDIRMPGIDGMTAAQRLRAQDSITPLVFVTSMVQYAVKGYEVDALDFIVKPVRQVTFDMKMKRIYRSLQMRIGHRIVLNVAGSSKVLSAVDIYYVEVINHELTYHTTNGIFTLRGKLGTAEQQLPSDSFFRVSASHLVNLRYLTQSTGDSVIVAGEEIRVSRAKKKNLMTAIASYLGKGGVGG
jgi:DNA-binding LytR/AlgR family response regulator